MLRREETARWSDTACASSRSPSGLPATGSSIASCCCARCWLHDIGLYTDSRDPYVTEGARLAARVLEPFGWPPARLQRCMDACEQHHAPRSQMAMGLEVELVRAIRPRRCHRRARELRA